MFQTTPGILRSVFAEIQNDPTAVHGLRVWQRWRRVRLLLLRLDGCSVERIFGISGRIAMWQRSRLRDSTISDLMMYKAVLNLMEFVLAGLEEEEDYPVNEVVGNI